MSEILRFHITDMQEAISTDTEIDKYGLDAWLEVYDFTTIDIYNEVLLTSSFYIKIFQTTIFYNRHTTFFTLCRVNDHFSFLFWLVLTRFGSIISVTI